MMAKELKKLGIVSEVGLERDATEFTVYNLKVGIKLKAEKKLSYTEGERLIKQLRKELLGKNIELEAVAVPCPMCGRVFNSEAGMKQHVRRQHNGAEVPAKKKRGRPKKAEPKKGSTKKKRSSSKKK